MAMEDPRINDLLNRLAAGDELAMKTIFHTFYSDVFQKIYRVLRQKEVSEDLTQEVFVKIWKKREDLNISQTLKGYLSTMAYHEAIGHLRKSSREPVIVEHTDLELTGDHHLELETRETQLRIERAIALLPPKCKGVFLLSRYESKSYREIGEHLDISVKTVENQMSKALKILRTALRDIVHMLLFLHWIL